MYKKPYKLNFPQRKKLLSYLNALLKEKSHDSYFIDLTVRRKMPEYKILKLARKKRKYVSSLHFLIQELVNEVNVQENNFY